MHTFDICIFSSNGVYSVYRCAKFQWRVPLITVLVCRHSSLVSDKARRFKKIYRLNKFQIHWISLWLLRIWLFREIVGHLVNEKHGPRYKYRLCLETPITQIRRSWDRVILIIGIPVLRGYLKFTTSWLFNTTLPWRHPYCMSYSLNTRCIQGPKWTT